MADTAWCLVLNIASTILFIIISTILLPGAAQSDPLAVILPSNVYIDFDRFTGIVRSYGGDPRDYVFEGGYYRLIAYRPWYEPDYIFVLGVLDVNGSTYKFLEIIYTGSSNASFTDYYIVLYRELSYLLEYGVLKGMVNGLEYATISTNDLSTTLNSTVYIEEIITSGRVLFRPRWESINRFYAFSAEGSSSETTNKPQPSSTPLTMFAGIETSTNPPPTLSTPYTTPAGVASNLSTSTLSTRTGAAGSPLRNYYYLLVSFLVAAILSLVTYYIMKRHY